MARVDFDIRGLPEVQAMLGEVSGQKLQNRIRKAMRAGVAVFRGPLRQKASSNRYPRKMRKTRTRGHRSPLGVSISPGSPLSPIFEHGARPHAIPITRGPFAGSVVQHPGMAARPLAGPVFDANRERAEDAFASKLLEGL